MGGEHLSQKTGDLLDRPIEERIAYIQKDSWIPYSRANKILQQLEDLLNHPKCDRMPNLAISAQTNNGKTRLIKHFLSSHQASESSGAAITAPVFYLQCPGVPDEARLYNSILLKLCKDAPPLPLYDLWWFQMRVCDDTGAAILSTTRPAPKTPKPGAKG